MNITIDKNVPLPTKRAGRPAIYPFGSMEIGDSFALPLSGEIKNAGKRNECDKAVSRVTSAASWHQKRGGGKFTVRVIKGEGVVRCWRVA